MSEECGSCEYNRQCFIKKNVGIFECEKEKIRVVRYEDYEKLENIIKEVREYLKFLKEHYEELRTSPVEDSYFINDMLRQMFIQSIENYLLGIEDILDKESE